MMIMSRFYARLRAKPPSPTMRRLMAEPGMRAMVAESARLDALLPVAAGEITSEQLLALVRADNLRLFAARRRIRQESYFWWTKRAWDAMRGDPTVAQAQTILDEWWPRRQAAWPTLRLRRRPRYALKAANEARQLDAALSSD